MRAFTLVTITMLCICLSAFAEDPFAAPVAPSPEDPFTGPAVVAWNPLGPEWSYSYSDTKSKSTIESANGMLIEVDGTLKAFDEKLNDLPANAVLFRRFTIKRAMDIGVFCNDLGELLDCTVRVPASIRRLQVPECTLRNINLISTLDTISLEADSRFLIQIDQQEGESLRSGNVMISVSTDQDPAETEVFSRIFRLPPPDASMGAMTDAQGTLELVISASQSALKTIANASGLPSKSLPEIQLHSETRIIIVAGKTKELEVVSAIVKAMGGELVAAPNSPGNSPALNSGLGGMGGGQF